MRDDPALIICCLDDVRSVVKNFRPTAVVSLLPAAEQRPTPRGIAPNRHHRVEIDDIAMKVRGQTLAHRLHMQALIDFLRSCDPRESLLVHCFAGVSRSPAAALIALTLDAPGREGDAAMLLRQHARHANPNTRLLQLADDALGRGRALVDAAESMGPPRGMPFAPPVFLPRRLPPL